MADDVGTGLQVELVAADRTVWSGEALMVSAPAADGEIGILPGHAPVLAVLVVGVRDVPRRCADTRRHQFPTSPHVWRPHVEMPTAPTHVMAPAPIVPQGAPAPQGQGAASVIVAAASAGRSVVGRPSRGRSPINRHWRDGCCAHS